MNQYLEKWGLFTNGIKEEDKPPIKNCFNILQSGIFSFLGIFGLVLIDHHADFMLIIASFAASAVLLYDCIESPLAQPRNAIGGHTVSGLVGVSLYKLFMLNNGKYFYKPLVGGLSVSLSIIAMETTKTVHPPGAATSLISVIGNQKILDHGYLFIVYPVFVGITCMVLIATITNNLSTDRRYPKYWY